LYGTGTLHVSRDFLLTAVLAASVLSFFSIPFFGHLSDQIGRKNMYLSYHSPYAIAFYILACAVLSLIATAMMKDYTGKDIGGEYE
jgi:MFS family permease